MAKKTQKVAVADAEATAKAKTKKNLIPRQIVPVVPDDADPFEEAEAEAEAPLKTPAEAASIGINQKRGRKPNEPRGVPGVNTNLILRTQFSNNRGCTIDTAVDAIVEATNGKERAAGGEYTREMAAARVAKALAAWAQKGLLENLGEVTAGQQKGMTRYRYKGEVVLPRSIENMTKARLAKAAAKEEVVESPAAAPITEKKASTKADKPKVAKAPVVETDDDDDDGVEPF